MLYQIKVGSQLTCPQTRLLDFHRHFFFHFLISGTNWPIKFKVIVPGEGKTQLEYETAKDSTKCMFFYLTNRFKNTPLDL